MIKKLHLLFAEESTRASPITVSVGRRILCVIVVVVGAGQDGAYTAGSNWKQEKIENVNRMKIRITLFELNFNKKLGEAHRCRGWSFLESSSINLSDNSGKTYCRERRRWRWTNKIKMFNNDERQFLSFGRGVVNNDDK